VACFPASCDRPQPASYEATGILVSAVANGGNGYLFMKQDATPMVWAEGVFLATNSPERKPSTIALIQKLQQSKRASAQ